MGELNKLIKRPILRKIIINRKLNPFFLKGINCNLKLRYAKLNLRKFRRMHQIVRRKINANKGFD
jgi:hypothetical protein